MSTATKKAPSKAPPRKPRPKAQSAPIDVLTLDAKRFGTAWGWVQRALSKDDSRPILASMGIEVYSPSSVRLVATSRYELLWCWVGDGDEPGPETEPLRTVMAYNHPRAKTFMSYLAKGSLADELTITIAENSRTFATAWESMTLTEPPVSGVAGRPPEFPNWRSIVRGWTAAPTEKVWISAERLAVTILPGVPIECRAAVMEFSGDLKPVRLEWPSVTPPIHGLLMPRRAS